MAKRGSEDTTVGAGQHPKKLRKPEEVSVKFLLPNVVVGSLLTRKAAGLRRIRDQVCHNKEFILQISGKDQFYPGTKDERMVAVQGQPHQVHRACCMLQDQIIDDPFLVKDESGENELGPRQGQMKIAVSDKAASKIIGAKGAVVKDISMHFNISITITPAKEVIVPDERVVTMVGPSQNIFDALDPIIFQISQQQVHISCEFDYDQYNKSKDAELNEEKTEESEVVKESEKDDQDVADTEKKDEDANVESSEDKTDDQEKTDAGTEEKTAEDKTAEIKPNSENKTKKAKNARKDGKWTWSSYGNNRSKWVWVENQKNSAHANNPPSFRGARGGSYGGRGRMWY